jgi:hypothetical protein
MESDVSTSQQSSSHQSTDQDNPTIANIFTLTKEDVEALSEYVDEFQEGDTDRRSTIIANAMADLVTLRPAGEPFNKLDASKVRLVHYVLPIQNIHV